MFYIHPWEIDPGAAAAAGWPAHAMAALQRPRQDTLDRLERLCDDFAFDTVSAMLCRSGPDATVPSAARWAHAK